MSARRYYSLYDKVYAPANLQRAWEQVRANRGAPGSDGQSIEQFEAKAAQYLEGLREQLREKRYRPRPVRRVYIPKDGGGKRPLGIPAVRDRIVQQALLQVLGPIFEASFSPYSHGFRPGRGCTSALEVVDQAVRWGYEWVVDADIVKFFDTVDHELVLDRVHERVTDGSVLRLIRMFLEAGVLEAGVVADERTQVGTPQGGPLSPLLANIVLHPLDAALRAAGFGLVRYADDFVIFTPTRERAQEALDLAQRVLTGLKLRLHPEKTRVRSIDEGFSFLGFTYRRDDKGITQKVVSARSVKRFRSKVSMRTRRHSGQRRPKVRQCTPARLSRNERVLGMIGAVNEYLVGWHGYFGHVNTTWREYFDSFDGFVRRRLRCAITGRYAKGRWHQLLPNALFDALGLLRLTRLHEQAHRDVPPLVLGSSYSGGSRMR